MPLITSYEFLMDEGEGGCLMPTPPSLLRQIHHFVKKVQGFLTLKSENWIFTENSRIFIADPSDNVLGDIHQMHNSIVTIILWAESFYRRFNGDTHK